MTNVYIIKFVETDVIYCYTSVEAIYTAHTKSEMGITKSSFYNALSGKIFYENRKVIINKISAYNATDVKDKLNKPSVIKS